MDAHPDNLAHRPRKDHHPRVFGVGFHKTGTTTLGVALEHLGYRVCHGAGPLRAALGHERMMALLHSRRLEPVFTVAERYDAFQDNPWYLLYRELDERFPGSLFVLTRRSERTWIRSVVRYFGESESDFRKWIYGVGSPVGNEELFRERYRRHNDEVVEHFADRPGQLLHVDWESGDGWPELCAFLERPVPDLPFPHANPSRPASRLRRWASRLGARLRPSDPSSDPVT